MNRRQFIKTGCIACASSLGAFTLLEGCAPQHYVSASMSKNNRIAVSKAEFIQIKKGNRVERPLVIVKTEALAFPIVLYKLNNGRYSALYLQCTHQGCELNAYDHMLVCPCHGAEFSTTGEVMQGPAENQLKTFTTTEDHETIYIQLA